MRSLPTGPASWTDFLARTDILVCLLPLTQDTRGILSSKVFDALPSGASLIDVGRGGHLVEPDLLQALDSGHLGAAILDVGEPRALARRSIRSGSHPRIWLTPHVASITQPETALESVLENLLATRQAFPERSWSTATGV